MKRKSLAVLCIILFLPYYTLAEELTLSQQVDEVRTQIEQERETQKKLRADLETMDTRIEELRKRLEELETKIGT